MNSLIHDLYDPCGLGIIIESRVERTHPDQALHKFNVKIIEIMDDKIIVALAHNQGHAAAMLAEDKK